MQLDGEKVRRGRLLLGYGAQAAADVASVSKNSFLRAERGDDLRPGTARKIAQALGVPLAELLENDSPKERRSSLEPSLFNGVEDERHTRPVSSEELKQRIAFMKRLAEDRRHTVADAEKKRTEPEFAWAWKMRAVDSQLDAQLEAEGIAGFVAEVKGGRRMTSYEMRLLCEDFIRELETLRQLTSRAGVVEQGVESETTFQATKGISKLEASLRGEGPKHDDVIREQ